MSLYNFVDESGPVIPAAYLNPLDLIRNAMSATAAGAVTIGPPTSAAGALTIVGYANSYAATMIGSSTIGQSYGLLIKAGTNASDAPLYMTNQSNSYAIAGLYGDGHGFIGYNGSAPTISWTVQGAVSVAAPSSGTGLTVNTSASEGFRVSGTTLNNNLVYLNWTSSNANDALFGVTSPGAGSYIFNFGNATGTTGASTPSLGTNKPGSNSSPLTWLAIKHNGTSGYIPVWS